MQKVTKQWGKTSQMNNKLQLEGYY